MEPPPDDPVRALLNQVLGWKERVRRLFLRTRIVEATELDRFSKQMMILPMYETRGVRW